MARREFEERIEETAEKASKVIEQPPDEMKPRAKEAMAEYIKELEQLYNLLVITDKDTEGLILEPRQVVLEKKHEEALKRISDLLYDTFIKMGKKEEAEKWKDRSKNIAKPGMNES